MYFDCSPSSTSCAPCSPRVRKDNPLRLHRLQLHRRLNPGKIQPIEIRRAINIGRRGPHIVDPSSLPPVKHADIAAHPLTLHPFERAIEAPSPLRLEIWRADVRRIVIVKVGVSRQPERPARRRPELEMRRNPSARARRRIELPSPAPINLLAPAQRKRKSLQPRTSSAR